MLLTISNLPSHTNYSYIKTLIKTRCGISEIILDNLMSEGRTKKVTAGLVQEQDAATVVQILDGATIEGNQLNVVLLQKGGQSQQPRRQSSSYNSSQDQSHKSYENKEQQPYENQGYQSKAYHTYDNKEQQSFQNQGHQSYQHVAQNMYENKGQQSYNDKTQNEAQPSYENKSQNTYGNNFQQSYQNQAQQQYQNQMQQQYPNQMPPNMGPVPPVNYQFPNNYPYMNAPFMPPDMNQFMYQGAMMGGMYFTPPGPNAPHVMDFNNQSQNSPTISESNRQEKQYSSPAEKNQSSGDNDYQAETAQDWGNYGNSGNNKSYNYNQSQSSPDRNQPNKPRKMRWRNIGKAERNDRFQDNSEVSSRRNDSFRRDEPSRRDETSRSDDNSRRDDTSRRDNSSRRDETFRRDEPSRRNESFRSNEPRGREEHRDQGSTTRFDRDNYGETREYTAQDNSRGQSRSQYWDPSNTLNADRNQDRKRKASPSREWNSKNSRQQAEGDRFQASSRQETRGKNTRPSEPVRAGNYPSIRSSEPARTQNAQAQRSSETVRGGNQPPSRPNAPPLEPRSKKGPKKPKTYANLVLQDQTWRQQAASQIGKEIAAKFPVPADVPENVNVLKEIKSAVYTRIELLLKNQFGVFNDIIVKRYRTTFPANGDKVFYNAIMDNIKKQYADAETAPAPKDGGAVKSEQANHGSEKLAPVSAPKNGDPVKSQPATPGPDKLAPVSAHKNGDPIKTEGPNKLSPVSAPDNGGPVKTPGTPGPEKLVPGNNLPVPLKLNTPAKPPVIPGVIILNPGQLFVPRVNVPQPMSAKSKKKKRKKKNVKPFKSLAERLAERTTHGKPRVPSGAPSSFSQIPQNKPTFGNLPQNIQGTLFTGKLPRYPQGDKQLYAAQKRNLRKEFFNDDFHTLDAPEAKALEDELNALCKIFKQGEMEPPRDNEEKKIQEKHADALKLFRKLIKLNTTKRMLNITSGLLIRVFFQGMALRRQLIRDFMEQFGIVSMKKATGKKLYYIATCASYDQYDYLLSMGMAPMSRDTTLLFKPFQLTGPTLTRTQQYKMRQKGALQDLSKQFQDDEELGADEADDDNDEDDEEAFSSANYDDYQNYDDDEHMPIKEEKEADNDGEVVADNKGEALPENKNEAMADTKGEVMAANEKEAMADNEKQALADNKKEAMADKEKEALADNEKEAMANNEKEALANNEIEAMADIEKEAMADIEKEAMADNVFEALTENVGEDMADNLFKALIENEGEAMADNEAKEIDHNNGIEISNEEYNDVNAAEFEDY